MLLENIHRTGITHDDHHTTIVIALWNRSQVLQNINVLTMHGIEGSSSCQHIEKIMICKTKENSRMDKLTLIKNNFLNKRKSEN